MEDKFKKEQILESKQFSNLEKDILKAILEDIEYSIDEVKQILKNFKDSEVK